MTAVFTGMPSMLLLTLASYLLGVFIHKKSGISVLHPFITAMVVIIGVIILFDIPYKEYREGARVLDFLLGPSVVALALRLYDNIEIVKKNLAAILSAVLTGSAVGILGVWALGRFMGCDSLFIKSLEAKSVTTPIAMELTAVAGGSTSLIAISVVLTGVIGAVLGPSFLKLLKITDPVAKGVAMGCSAHGIGTGRAIELGAVEGAVSGLCIVLMGVATSILLPLINCLLGI
ncbi:MAG: LrgB family protein [Bacteroidales bacterium]|nr:LrgB family protein [Bacteroidales bacterium]